MENFLSKARRDDPVGVFDTDGVVPDPCSFLTRQIYICNVKKCSSPFRNLVANHEETMRATYR